MKDKGKFIRKEDLDLINIKVKGKKVVLVNEHNPNTGTTTLINNRDEISIKGTSD